MAWDPFAGTFTPLLCDGFDNYIVGTQRWTIGTDFRTGQDCHPDFSRHAWGQGAYVVGNNVMIEVPGRSAMIIEGAFNLRSRGFQQPGHPLISWVQLGINNWGLAGVYLTESRHIHFRNLQTNLTLAGPTTGPERVMEFLTWYWFSLYVKIHNTAGEMVLYVNGDEWLRVEGVNTFHTSASGFTANCLQLSRANGPEFYVDDIVIQDGTVGKFMGDMIVLGKRPDAAGYITQFTPSGAANNWDCVEEVAADDDTTHVASDVLGERDSYLLDKITEVPDTSIVLAVQQTIRHRKDEPGPRSVTAFTRVDPDETLGEERFPSETSYLTSIEAPQLLQPDGVSDWGTVAAFNALDVEIGQETGDGLMDES